MEFFRPLVKLRLALSKDGYAVETYALPADALKRIDEKEFDVVVTDIRMDEVNGMEVLERALGRSGKTKVIMITGFARVELARYAMENGAFDFIEKPFTPDDLRAAVGKAVGVY